MQVIVRLTLSAEKELRQHNILSDVRGSSMEQ